MEAMAVQHLSQVQERRWRIRKESLTSADSAVFAAIADERHRQLNSIELIAREFRQPGRSGGARLDPHQQIC